jgi:hypothetical protein
MLKKIYVCGCCGAERKEANHWFILQRTRVGFALHTWAWAQREGQLDEDDVEHLCGQECAHKMLGRFMEEVGGA